MNPLWYLAAKSTGEENADSIDNEYLYRCFGSAWQENDAVT